MRKFVTPIAAGLVYGLLAGKFWDLYNAASPVDGWLIEGVASEGYGTVYALTDRMHTALVHVLFASPLIGGLVYAGYLQSWGYVLAASAAALLAATLGPGWSSPLLEDYGFWLDSATVAAGPLLATVAARALKA